MFRSKSNNNETPRNPGMRVLRVVAWGALALLWIFIIFLMGNYWLEEVPATRRMYDAGLEQGFDALAGIVAASDPTWQQVRNITGRPIGGRLNRLQGDTMFNVWHELDGDPAWNSGLASIRFDQQGRLLWVRRYFTATPPVDAVNQNTGEVFPVIKPRVDLRGRTNMGFVRQNIADASWQAWRPR